MVHTPRHKSKASSVRKPGDPPVRPKPVRSKSSRKPKLSPTSKIMTQKTEAGIRKAKRKAKTVTNAPVDMSGVRRMPNRSMADAGAAATKAFKEFFKGPKTPITYNPTRKTPTKKITPPADMRPKSKASSVVKPTNEEARRTEQANRLGAKPPVAPRVYKNKAKERVAKAKDVQSFIAAKKASNKGYKQTGMDQADMPAGKLSAGSAAMTAKTEANIKGVTKRQGMSQVEMSGARRMPRKSMKAAGKEGWEAFKKNVTGLLGTFTSDQARRRGSNTGEAIKTPKGRSNKYVPTAPNKIRAADKAKTESKSPAPQPKSAPKPKPAESKAVENENTANTATSSKEVKVTKATVRSNRQPKARYAAPKPNQSSQMPKGDTGVEKGFEASMLRSMSKLFGGVRMSVPSGMEGTDSWSTLSVDSKGKVTRKKRKSDPRRNMGDQDN